MINRHTKTSHVKNRGRGFTLIELMIVIAIIAILTTILLPNFVRARSQARMTGCKTNLKNVATAVESYSADNANRYPVSLTKLTPSHISIIPTCPSAGNNTAYISGYASASLPDVYTVVCSGSNHNELGLPDNFPQYHSAEGLKER